MLMLTRDSWAVKMSSRPKCYLNPNVDCLPRHRIA